MYVYYPDPKPLPSLYTDSHNDDNLTIMPLKSPYSFLYPLNPYSPPLTLTAPRLTPQTTVMPLFLISKPYNPCPNPCPFPVPLSPYLQSIHSTPLPPQVTTSRSHRSGFAFLVCVVAVFALSVAVGAGMFGWYLLTSREEEGGSYNHSQQYTGWGHQGNASHRYAAYTEGEYNILQPPLHT